MAGHSHFANIANKKALIDSKRGKLWSKLSRAITVAAKMGDGDPDHNARLRFAINEARAVSMPKDNIIRAIKKGTGELEGENLEEVVYEGYGPAGVAVLCEILTDNRNRTAGEVRKIFEVHGGNLGGAGCVSWIFETKGLFVIPANKISEDALLEIVVEAGGEDVKQVEANFEVICATDQFQNVSDALAAKKIAMERAQLTRIPSNTVDLDAEQGHKIFKLIEKLDDNEDIQVVYANYNIPDDALAQMAQQ